jgi:hypothetical protein
MLYFASRLFLPPLLPPIITVWLQAEIAFYFFVYLPRRWILQRPATHPSPLPPPERKALFNRCIEQIPDPDRYWAKWFKDAPLSDIKRENVKEFYRWALLNTGVVDPRDEAELEEYVHTLEERTGWKMEPGFGRAKCLRPTLDKVEMAHRSLAWYMVSPFSNTFQFPPPPQFAGIETGVLIYIIDRLCG